MLSVNLLPVASLPMPLHIYVVSHTPGRLRFRMSPEHRNPEVMEAIADALQSFTGQIETVRITPAIGSITVYYTGDRGSFEQTMETLRHWGVVMVDRPAEPSNASQQVSRAIARANQWVAWNTEGAVDLRFLVPLAFGILTLKQLFSKSPGLNAAPWYVLAWYAFDSFIKLNYEMSPSSASTSSKNDTSTP